MLAENQIHGSLDELDQLDEICRSDKFKQFVKDADSNLCDIVYTTQKMHNEVLEYSIYQKALKSQTLLKKLIEAFAERIRKEQNTKVPERLKELYDKIEKYKDVLILTYKQEFDEKVKGLFVVQSLLP